MSNHSITYAIELDPEDFGFWSGAEDRMNDATEEQKEQVYERLEEWFDALLIDGEIPSDTDVNDFVWFECDDIFFPEEG